MDLPPLALGWLKPALNVAAILTIAAPMATSAVSSEVPQSQTLNEGATPKQESTQFVPEDHKGVVCMAMAPQCMTKKQWAAYCLSETNLMASKSCRDALDQSAPNQEES